MRGNGIRRRNSFNNRERNSSSRGLRRGDLSQFGSKRGFKKTRFGEFRRNNNLRGGNMRRKY